MMQKTTEIQAKSKSFQGVEAQIGARRQAQSGPKSEAELMEQFGSLLDKIASHLASNPRLVDKRGELPSGLVSLAQGAVPGHRPHKTKKAESNAPQKAEANAPQKAELAQSKEQAPASVEDGDASKNEVKPEDNSNSEEQDAKTAPQLEVESDSPEAPEVTPAQVIGKEGQAPTPLPILQVPTQTESQEEPEEATPTGVEEVAVVLPNSVDIQQSSDIIQQPVLSSEAEIVQTAADGGEDQENQGSDEAGLMDEIPAPMPAVLASVVPESEPALPQAAAPNPQAAPVSDLPANPANLPDEGLQAPPDGGLVADELLRMQVPEQARRDIQGMAAASNEPPPGVAPENRVDPEQLMSLLIQQAAQRVLSVERGVDAPAFKAVELALKNSPIEGVSHSQGLQAKGGEQADTTGLKRQERGSALAPEKEKSAKALTRISSLRTMEKVEGALEEIARSKNGQTISLDLDPQTLGKVRVGVSLKEGLLFARIVAQNPEVAEMLRNRASELQAMLKRLGLKVDEVHVNVSGGNGWNFGENLGARSEQGRESGQRAAIERSVAADSGSEAQTAEGGLERKEAPLDHWVA